MNEPELYFENMILIGITMLIKSIAVRVNDFALLIFSRPLK